MKAHYIPHVCLIHGKRVDEDDLCWICEKSCQPDEHDNDGNPIHEDCKVNRNAMEADDRWTGC